MTNAAGSSQSSTLARLDFTTFILSISSAAFMGLGIAPRSPNHGETAEALDLAIDLELAQQNIDLLELMREKTRGNLSAEESRLLEQLLFETRMHFVEAIRKQQGGK